MSMPPTMQSLALYARDHFGEDGYPFEDSRPSSLDIVMVSYADEAQIESVFARASATLHQRLLSRGRAIGLADVYGFVWTAITYLRALHPDPASLQQQERQRFLSHLFWANLVEARHAPGAPGRTARPEEHSSATSSRVVEAGSAETETRLDDGEAVLGMERERRDASSRMLPAASRPRRLTVRTPPIKP